MTRIGVPASVLLMVFAHLPVVVPVVLLVRGVPRDDVALVVGEGLLRMLGTLGGVMAGGLVIQFLMQVRQWRLLWRLRRFAVEPQVLRIVQLSGGTKAALIGLAAESGQCLSSVPGYYAVCQATSDGVHLVKRHRGQDLSLAQIPWSATGDMPLVWAQGKNGGIIATELREVGKRSLHLALLGLFLPPTRFAVAERYRQELVQLRELTGPPRA